MLKLRQTLFDNAGNATSSLDCGTYRSYKDIGKWLLRKGKLGTYYVLPSNMASLLAMKEIIVTKDKYGKQVIMDGSVY